MDKNLILDSKKQIIIYGAGRVGRKVLDLLKDKSVEVNCFLDEKGGSNMFLEGIPIFKPNNPLLDKKSRVIVALFNERTDVTSVISFLKSIGFKDIIPYTKLFMYFSDELPTQYWLGPTDIYKKHSQEIADALALFHDKTSCDLFNSFLKFRITGDPFCMPKPDIENIYFPKDIKEVRKPDKFIDCGAFDGDTLKAIKKRFGIIKSIRAFEPDSENFSKLTALKANGEQFSKDTILIPYGAWSSTGCFKFISDGSSSSNISENGDLTIRCVKLDEYLIDYQPTLIKMDIEGAEIEALKGCQKMIASVKPDLAISVYHSADHLWKIPLFISKLNPDYKFYLRSHGYNGYDTVFYAYNK